jgi:AraC-like DNA-binding protein
MPSLRDIPDAGEHQLQQPSQRVQTGDDAADEACKRIDRLLAAQAPHLVIGGAYSDEVRSCVHRGEIPRARQMIARALLYSEQAKSAELRAYFTYYDAYLDGNCGDMPRQFRRLVELACSPLYEGMAGRHRVQLFLLLACLCAAIDADDSLTLCLQLALTAHEGELPLAFESKMAHHELLRWIWSDRTFETLLTRPQLGEAERSRLLDAAAAYAIRVIKSGGRESSEEAESVCRARVVLLACQGLRAGVRGQLDEAATVLENAFKAGSSASAYRHSIYLLVAAAQCLGHLTLAQRAMPWLETTIVAEQEDERLQRLHLQSIVAAAAGDQQHALSLYQFYARLHARYAQAMLPDVRALIGRLSTLPGARPGDNPAHRPAYLRNALALAASGQVVRAAALAGRVGVSERTLRDAFRVHLGCSPKAYLTEQRLEAARRFVQSGECRGLDLMQIAERFGFSHAGRFSALYRARFGVSPTADLDSLDTTGG